MLPYDKVNSFYNRASTILEEVGAYDKEEGIHELNDITHLKSFPEIDDAPIYKFVSDGTLDYLR